MLYFNMKNQLLIVTLLFLFSTLSGQTQFDQKPTVEAAQKFLASLSADLKPLAQLAFTDKDRKMWSNLPFESVERRGVRMDSLDEKQRLIVHELLRTVLSQQGYQKMLFTMQYDQAIRERLTKAKSPIAQRYSHEQYWLTIFGDPSTTQTWGWQFEGHHVSLNMTHSPKGVSCTPMFTGINPALTTEGVRAGEYVMYEENEIGKKLYSNLSTQLKKQALLDSLPKNVDVMAQTGEEGFLRDKRGVAYTDMTKDQQKMVEIIIKSWVENMTADIAAEKWARIQKSLPQTKFIWLGDGNLEHLHYYRLVSPAFSIEMTNRDGGIYHLHTLWRDLGEDFGVKF
jgi:Protein of unknown function (DUF3500)